MVEREDRAAPGMQAASGSPAASAVQAALGAPVELVNPVARVALDGRVVAQGSLAAATDRAPNPQHDLPGVARIVLADVISVVALAAAAPLAVL